VRQCQRLVENCRRTLLKKNKLSAHRGGRLLFHVIARTLLNSLSVISVCVFSLPTSTACIRGQMMRVLLSAAESLIFHCRLAYPSQSGEDQNQLLPLLMSGEKSNYFVEWHSAAPSFFIFRRQIGFITDKFLNNFLCCYLRIT
jgi:hypothetical protein